MICQKGEELTLYCEHGDLNGIIKTVEKHGLDSLYVVISLYIWLDVWFVMKVVRILSQDQPSPNGVVALFFISLVVVVGLIL